MFDLECFRSAFYRVRWTAAWHICTYLNPNQLRTKSISVAYVMFNWMSCPVSSVHCPVYEEILTGRYAYNYRTKNVIVNFNTCDGSHNLAGTTFNNNLSINSSTCNVYVVTCHTHALSSTIWYVYVGRFESTRRVFFTEAFAFVIIFFLNVRIAQQSINEFYLIKTKK